jgi:hypothetical protein
VVVPIPYNAIDINDSHFGDLPIERADVVFGVGKFRQVFD